MFVKSFSRIFMQFTFCSQMRVSRHKRGATRTSARGTEIQRITQGRKGGARRLLTGCIVCVANSGVIPYGGEIVCIGCSRRDCAMCLCTGGRPQVSPTLVGGTFHHGVKLVRGLQPRCPIAWCGHITNISFVYPHFAKVTERQCVADRREDDWTSQAGQRLGRRLSPGRFFGSVFFAKKRNSTRHLESHVRTDGDGRRDSVRRTFLGTIHESPLRIGWRFTRIHGENKKLLLNPNKPKYREVFGLVILSCVHFIKILIIFAVDGIKLLLCNSV